MSDKYFGLFTSREAVAREFEEGTGGTNRWHQEGDPFIPADTFPTDEQILLAVYEYGSYEGSAYVLFRGADGNLYEVEAGHCSCNGLENSWTPGLVTPESLALRIKAKAEKQYVYGPFETPEVWQVYETTVHKLLEGRA